MTDKWQEAAFEQAGIDMFEAKVHKLLSEFNFLAGTKHDQDRQDSKPSDPQYQPDGGGDSR